MRIENPEQISTPPNGRPAREQPSWRQDFPIDWPQDEYRSRRDFIKLLGLTSLAFVVGQAWIVTLSAMRKARGQLPLLDLGSLNDLAVGGIKQFDYPAKGDACVLVRVQPDQLVAYSQKCTHLSCPVIPRPAEGRFYCPCHEGSFDLRSGEPLAGPPRRRLPKVKLEVRNGRIYAAGLEEGLV
ncbi:MAG TPA: Rieske (2Fe-2S) protein [Candidatus Sulfotelmatobacter sp.]|nr:Rieske (2Fe-2S) protein [Candidatus Sulfotelmatobacter sp.]HWI58024.1 Rieske (2Fe-2S) protein [Bacillota bacterium]